MKSDKPLMQPTIRARAMPSETNPAGDIFGGWIMSQMDIAGEVASQLRAKGRVVTVAVAGMEFKQPVYVGDVVSFYTEIERIGRTSITIRIKAVAMRNKTGEHVSVTEGVFIYVALDENGQKKPIPKEA
ncbi:MAG: acyl-CoA thioesterase [Hellea sp.]